MSDTMGNYFDDYKQDDLPNSVIPSLTRIQQYKTEVGFKTLVDGIEDNLYVVPNFQRVYRWSFEQVNNLAISLYLGLPIPPIYVYRNSNNQFEILDGQQRVISLYFYYRGIFTKNERNNQLQLKKIGRDNRKFYDSLIKAYDMEPRRFEMTYNEAGETKKLQINYEGLSDKIRRIIDYTALTVIEINVDSKENRQKLLCKIFANLNSGGVNLTNQELRNGIYQCDFYRMIMNFNDGNTKWRTLYGKPDKYSRDVEFLIRFCSLKYFMEYKECKFQLKNFKTYTQLLDDFSFLCQNFTVDQIMVYQQSLEKFLKLIPGNISKKIILWESLFVIIDKTGYDSLVSIEKCREIEEDTIYKSTVSNGTTNVSRIEERLRRVYELLR